MLLSIHYNCQKAANAQKIPSSYSITHNWIHLIIIHIPIGISAGSIENHSSWDANWNLHLWVQIADFNLLVRLPILPDWETQPWHIHVQCYNLQVFKRNTGLQCSKCKARPSNHNLCSKIHNQISITLNTDIPKGL